MTAVTEQYVKMGNALGNKCTAKIYIKVKRFHTRSADNDKLHQVNKMMSQWLNVSDIKSKRSQLNWLNFLTKRFYCV